MQASKWLSSLGVVLLLSNVAAVQDPTKVSPDTYKVVLENATVRIFRVTGPAGNKVAMHTHPDHIAIPLTPAKIQFSAKGGKPETMDMASESASYVPAGAHESANVGTTPLEAIVIELKAAAGTAEIPSAREGQTIKVLAEGPKAVAYRATADPSFQEPAGTKHDYAQVVVALEPSQMSLSIDGKPARTSWARGDVQFIGRGVPHESKNTGGKPADFIIIAIK
jgi:quercetin dioxygenase-like cupin family protein